MLFFFSSIPPRAWAESPKKRKKSEILSEILEHLEEEESNKDEAM